MSIHLLESREDLEQYDQWIKTHSEGSLWQSLEWKKYQEALGREVRIYVDVETGITASALVVIDRTAFGLSTWEITRGPLGEVNELLQTIVNDAKKDRCLTLYLSPLKLLGRLAAWPLGTSARHVVPTATRQIDLTKSEEEILAQMKQKGRYNIGIAEKNGVTIEHSTDIDAYIQLTEETAARDRFQAHSKKHYEAFLRALPGSFLLLARDTSKKPLAGLLGVCWNGQGIYYYGASSYAQRALMGPYLLQWEAMKYCKSKGCQMYDLFGIAPPDEEDHPWKGISQFKEKFGGTVVAYPPEQQIVLRPLANAMLQLKRKMF